MQLELVFIFDFLQHSPPTDLEPQSWTMPDTALLVSDCQNGIVDMILQGDAKEAFLQGTAATIAAARKAGMLVVYVIVAFRRGHPEISADNERFRRVKEMGGFIEGDASVQLPAAIAPHEGDVVVSKRRVSALAHTDLELILRCQGVRNVVLTGLATSGVVLSTLREASDRDFSVTVLEDLCGDRDAEVHRVLMEKVFPAQAKVKTSEAWISSIGA